MLTETSTKMLAPLTRLGHKKRNVFRREGSEFIQRAMNHFRWADVPKNRIRETRNAHLPWRCPLTFSCRRHL